MQDDWTDTDDALLAVELPVDLPGDQEGASLHTLTPVPLPLVPSAETLSATSELCLAPIPLTPVTPVSHRHHAVVHSPALSTPERVPTTPLSAPLTPLLTAPSPYSIPAPRNVTQNDFDRVVQENQMLRNELKRLREDMNSFMKCANERLCNLEKGPAPINSLLPSQSALDYILEDPRYDKMNIDKAVSYFTIELADIYFGEEVLTHSSLTGRSGSRLDYRLLEKIEDGIKNKFSSRIPREKMGAAIELCHSTISTRCKTLKQRQKKSSVRRGLLD